MIKHFYITRRDEEGRKRFWCLGCKKFIDFGDGVHLTEPLTIPVEVAPTT